MLQRPAGRRSGGARRGSGGGRRGSGGGRRGSGGGQRGSRRGPLGSTGPLARSPGPRARSTRAVRRCRRGPRPALRAPRLGRGPPFDSQGATRPKNTVKLQNSHGAEGGRTARSDPPSARERHTPGALRERVKSERCNLERAVSEQQRGRRDGPSWPRPGVTVLHHRAGARALHAPASCLDNAVRTILNDLPRPRARPRPVRGGRTLVAAARRHSDAPRVVQHARGRERPASSGRVADDAAVSLRG
jgi:hypothetical protein